MAEVQEEKALEQLRKDKKRYEEKEVSRTPDVTKVIAGLREEVTILRGELEAAVLGDRVILDRQQHVDRVMRKQEELRKSKGRNEWWLYDRRNAKKPPVKFFSTATTPQAAYSDYQQRTGHRFVGSGSNPFYCKPPEVTAEK